MQFLKRAMAAALLCCTLLSAYAADFTVDGIRYRTTNYYSDNVEVTYPSYSSPKYSGNIVIPTTVKYGTKSYSVTGIGSEAFKDCSDLTSITLPLTLQTIDTYAFLNCTSLKSIVVPQYVTEICSGAFAGCSALSSVNIPSMVTAIQEYTFSGCVSLTEMTFHSGIRTIGACAFANCDKITELTIPATVTRLGYHVFAFMPGLRKITIADSDTPLVCVSGYMEDDGYSYETVGEYYDIDTLYVGRPIEYEAYGYANLYSALSLVKAKELIIGGDMQTVPRGFMKGNTTLAKVTIRPTVMTFNDGVFVGCTGLKEVVIEDGDTELNLGYGDYDYYYYPAAFAGAKLEKVYMGRNIYCYQRSGYYSRNSMETTYCTPFYNQTALADITIGPKVTKLGYCLFENCTALKSVTIGENITEINAAYAGCKNLEVVNFNAINCTSASFPLNITKFNIGPKVDHIPSSCFSDIYQECAISELTIPENVKSIGTKAFQGLRKLTSINFDAIDCDIDASAVNVLPGTITDIVFGSKVKSIPNRLANGCSGINTITLPASVEKIGTHAFYDANLTEIYCLGEKPASYSPSSFNANTCQTGRVHVSATALAAYRAAWTDFKHIMAEGADVSLDITLDRAGTLLNKLDINKIEDYTAIKIAGSVNGTDILALNKMVNLRSVDLSNATIVSGGMNYYEQDNNTFGTKDNTLGSYWAYNLENLESVVLPENLVKIDHSAFSGKSRLKALTVPASVTYINYNSFLGCTALASLHFDDSTEVLELISAITSYGKGLFADCPVTELYIGRPLKGNYAFRDMVRVQDIKLGSTVTMLPDYCFNNCRSMRSINIPAAMTSIGKNAFNECRSLERVDIESLDGWYNITLGDEKATPTYYATPYVGGELVTKLTIPATLSEIRPFTFYNWKQIEELELHGGIKKIEQGAFFGCASLKALTIPASVEQIYYDAFGSNYSLAEVTIADNIKSLIIMYPEQEDAYYAKTREALFDKAPIAKVYFGRNLEFYGDTKQIDIERYGNYYGYSPFYDKENLADITIGTYVMAIPPYAFGGAKALKAINIPANVKFIHRSAFGGCTALKDVNLPASLTEIEPYTFDSCEALESITIPGGVRTIGTGAFYQCTALANINMINPIPAVISSDTFDATTAASAALNVPDQSVASYWLHPYWGQFRNIKTWNSGSDDTFSADGITYHLTSAANGTVEVAGATDATTAEIPASITVNNMTYTVNGVANEAFSGNKTLQAVSMPATTSYVGVAAFAGCPALKSVTILAKEPPMINDDSFDADTYTGATLYVPFGAETTYSGHNIWGAFNNISGVSGVENISIDAEGSNAVYVDADGTIVAPEGSRVFNIAGHEVSLCPGTGIYIVVAPGCPPAKIVIK